MCYFVALMGEPVSMESDLTPVNAFQDFLATDASKVKVGSCLWLISLQYLVINYLNPTVTNINILLTFIHSIRQVI